MAMKSKQNVERYRSTKADKNKQDLKSKTEAEKKLIYSLERQAQALESKEERLIARL